MCNPFFRPLLLLCTVCSSVLPAFAQTTTPAPAKPAATLPAAPRPNTEELRALFELQKYPDIIRAVAAHQNATKRWADEDDAYAAELLILKAESLLCTKNLPAAAETYHAAAKRAPHDSVKNLAAATALLIRKTPAIEYTARTTLPDDRPDETKKVLFEIIPPAKPKRYSLLDLTTRAALLKQFFYDELATAGIDKAEKTISLLALVAPTEKIPDLLILENAALGDSKNVATAQAVLRLLAARNIKTAMSSANTYVARCKREAEKIGEYKYQIIVGTSKRDVIEYRKRGLTEAQGKELKTLIDDCDRASTALAELRTRLNDTANELTLSETTIASVRELALAVLTADYSSPTGNPNR